MKTNWSKLQLVEESSNVCKYYFATWEELCEKNYKPYKTFYKYSSNKKNIKAILNVVNWLTIIEDCHVMNVEFTGRQ